MVFKAKDFALRTKSEKNKVTLYSRQENKNKNQNTINVAYCKWLQKAALGLKLNFITHTVFINIAVFFLAPVFFIAKTACSIFDFTHDI